MKDSKFMKYMKVTKRFEDERFIYLDSKDLYIDNLLQNETITAFKEGLKGTKELKISFEDFDEYQILKYFINAIDGLESVIILERVKETISQGEQKTNNEKIEILEQQKIETIKDFVNWLYQE